MPRLEHSQCALLRDDKLVDRYNAVYDRLEMAAQELPRFAEKEVVKQARDGLEQLALKLTKKRFFIGFIGPSQVGKSRTVCNLLSVNEDNAPTPTGAGGPTTSVPTRTVPMPPASNAENSIRLHYFSTDQFHARVRDICDLLGVRFDTDLRQVREGVLEKRRTDEHFKAADVDVLLRLIDAALAFPQFIEQKGREDNGDWADRRRYTTHQNEVSKFTLLREVSTTFVTDAISPEVEMIDLPGIDVDKESDALLTLAFVRDLDGAFMVQAGSQVKAGAIGRLAERMREHHKRTLGERIWMVIAKCDQLTTMHTEGPKDRDDQPTMFCHLAEVMKQQGIQGRNVHFVANEYYQLRRQEGLGDAEPASAGLVARFPTILQFDAAGRVIVPERCRRNEGQVGPWEQLAINGGIPALRETMQTKVADSVREQNRRDIELRLVAVIDQLIDALQAAEQQAGMTVEEMMRAARWSGELGRVAADIGREEQYSQESATVIGETLGRVIDDVGPPTRDGLAEHHRNLTGLLTNVGLHEAEQQTDFVATLVKTNLERRTEAQPPPTAAGLPTPLDYWSNVMATWIGKGMTADGKPFRAPIFAGLREDPSPVSAGGQIDPEDYIECMRSKAGRVARVFVSRLVIEIQSHLHHLQKRYRAVGSETDHIDRDQRERYAKHRTELERLRV